MTAAIKMSGRSTGKLVLTVSGNLAAGKTTLCKRLESTLVARNLRARVLYERFEKIETLPAFYSHLKEKGFVYNPYSLETQLAFMKDRKNQLDEALADSGCDLIVEDRSVYEFAQVFAKSHASMGLMSPAEYEIYKRELAHLDYLPLPDILLYLSRSTDAVKSRDRSIERGLADQYLDQLTSNLEEFVTCMSNLGTEVSKPSEEMLDSDMFITDQGCTTIADMIDDKLRLRKTFLTK